MRQSPLTLLVLTILTVIATSLPAAVDTEGATPGTWTMDVDAAKQVAVKKQLPILLNFSGSDWCGWCKLMEKNVFSKPKWKGYAKEGLVMVVIDFPNDASIVPKKYVDRNKAIKEQYNVKGFPTFILLDADGKTVLGKLGAGRDKTPASFIAEIRQLARLGKAATEAYIKRLKPEDQTAYRAIMDEMSTCAADIDKQTKLLTATQKKIESLEEMQEDLETRAVEFRVSQLGPDAEKAYAQLKEDLATEEKKLAAWLKSRPKRNEENAKKFSGMQKKIKEITEKLAQY